MKRNRDSEIVQKASQWDKAKKIFNEFKRVHNFYDEGKKEKAIQEQDLKVIDSEITELKEKEVLLQRCQHELSSKLREIMESTPLSEFEVMVGLKKNIDFLLSESQKLRKVQKNRDEKLEELNNTKIGISFIEMHLEQIEAEFQEIFRN